MKQFLMLVLALFVTTGLGIAEAEAKRLGGGKSFGMQRDNVMRRDAAPAAPAAPTTQAAPTRPGAAPGAPQPSGMSRWLGPIAGLAAGLGLAALASHLGLGEEFATFLLLALLAVGAVFLFRMLRRPKTQPAGLQYAGSGLGGGTPAAPRPLMPAGGAAPASPNAAAVPAGFDVEGFLRNAKVNFLRLQAANDAGNVEDIREFTTPEMFAELRLDLQDRAGAKQQTDVVTLEADLLDVSEEGDRYFASVRFHGSIREAESAQPEAFDEVWHLSKPVKGGGWVIAGIQQTH
jgi:predicted lipid-binding transport protein (Tim44 family)